MAGFLIAVSVIVGIFGGMLFSQSKTVFQEIEAGILFIISAVYFSGGCIVNEIADLRKDHKKRDEKFNSGEEK